MGNTVRLDFAQYLWHMQKESITALLYTDDEEALAEGIKMCALRAKILSMLAEFVQSCPLCRGTDPACDFCSGRPVRLIGYEMVMERDPVPDNVLPFPLRAQPPVSETPADA